MQCNYIQYIILYLQYLRFHRNMLFLKLFGKTTVLLSLRILIIQEFERQRKLTKTKSIDSITKSST